MLFKELVILMVVVFTVCNSSSSSDSSSSDSDEEESVLIFYNFYIPDVVFAGVHNENYTLDQSKCEDICDNEYNDCAKALYVSKNDNCRLYDSRVLDIIFLDHDDSSSSSSSSSSSDSDSDSSDSSSSSEEDYDRADNHNECQEECDKKSDCVTFSYNEHNDFHKPLCLLLNFQAGNSAISGEEYELVGIFWDRQ